QDSEASYDEQGAQHQLAAAARLQKALSPAHHEFSGNGSENQQRQSRADTKDGHHACHMPKVSALRRENRGGAERRTDARAPGGTKQQTDTELRLQSGCGNAAKTTVRPAAQRSPRDRQP